MKRKGFLRIWFLGFSIIALAFMAPMITSIFGDVLPFYNAPVGFIFVITLPVLAFALFYYLVIA